MSAKDLAETLQVLVDKGPALRKAGYLSVSVGDLSATLAPEQAEAAPITLADLEAAAAEQAREQLRGKGDLDPDLYPGGVVPSRSRDRGNQERT